MASASRDRYEPYLEPLFVPGFFGVILYIAVYSFIGAIWYGHWPIQILFLVSGFGLLASTVLVLVYELLLVIRVFKIRSIVKQPEGAYKIVRWIFGLIGVISIGYTFWAAIFIWQRFSHLPPADGPYDNSITLEN